MDGVLTAVVQEEARSTTTNRIYTRCTHKVWCSTTCIVSHPYLRCLLQVEDIRILIHIIAPQFRRAGPGEPSGDPSAFGCSLFFHLLICLVFDKVSSGPGRGVSGGSLLRPKNMIFPNMIERGGWGECKRGRRCVVIVAVISFIEIGRNHVVRRVIAVPSFYFYKTCLRSRCSPVTPQQIKIGQ